MGCDLVHSIHSLSVSSNLQILLHFLHHQKQPIQAIKIKPIKGQEKLIEWKLKKLKIEKKRKRGCYKCVFSANKILKSDIHAQNLILKWQVGVYPWKRDSVNKFDVVSSMTIATQIYRLKIIQRINIKMKCCKNRNDNWPPFQCSSNCCNCNNCCNWFNSDAEHHRRNNVGEIESVDSYSLNLMLS